MSLKYDSTHFNIIHSIKDKTFNAYLSVLNKWLDNWFESFMPLGVLLPGFSSKFTEPCTIFIQNNNHLPKSDPLCAIFTVFLHQGKGIRFETCQRFAFLLFQCLYTFSAKFQKMFT